MTSVEPGDEAEQVTAPEDVILAARRLLRSFLLESQLMDEPSRNTLAWRSFEPAAERIESSVLSWSSLGTVMKRVYAEWEADADDDQEAVRKLREQPRHLAASAPGRYYGTAIVEGRRMWEELLVRCPGDPVISMFAALFHSSWYARRGHEILDECERLGGERLQILFCRAAQHCSPADPRESSYLPDEERRKALAFLEEARALCGDSLRERRLEACALEDCMALHTALGKWPEARRCGEQLIALGSADCRRLHEQVRHAHQRLGLLYLIQGDAGFDLAAARACLLDAAAMMGADDAPPSHLDWALADALFQEGGSDAVVDFLEACRDGWPERTEQLDEWIAAFRAGEAPEAWTFAREFGQFERPVPVVADEPGPLFALGGFLLTMLGGVVWFMVCALRAALPGRLWNIYRAQRALQRKDFLVAKTQAELVIRKATRGRSPLSRRTHLVVGHILRGRSLLGEGRVEEAKADLLVVGRGRALDGTITFSDPDMALAGGLWAAGEKDAVIDYFALCGQARTMGRQSDEWIASMDEEPVACGAAKSDSASDRVQGATDPSETP